MIGSFLTRGLVMVFGYAYPAYECFKSVEKNKPDIEQLRFWCQYWILVAVLTVCERIGDTFVSWVPMYSEAKLAFYIYLWYPRTKGTTYVYDSFFRPYISKHETDIDRNLMELRTRAGDIVVLYWQRAASYGQTRVFDVLQYIASQSTPKPRPSQPPQTGRPRQPAPNRRAAQQQTKEPPTPASSSSSSSSSDSAPPQIGDTESEGLPPTPSSPPAAALKAQRTIPPHSLPVVAKALTPNKAEMMETEPSTSSNPILPPKAVVAKALTPNKAEMMETEPSSSSNPIPPPKAVVAKALTPNKAEMMETEPSSSSNPIPPPKETIMEAAVRVYTRGRSRKNNASSVQ